MEKFKKLIGIMSLTALFPMIMEDGSLTLYDIMLSRCSSIYGMQVKDIFIIHFCILQVGAQEVVMALLFYLACL